jgi:release factor glutamine methyltransferase
VAIVTTTEANEMEFAHLTIQYDDRVLRPRPWTATQSRWAAELIRRAPDGPVLELCTGAGHIGLLAVALEPRPLVAVDLDPVACHYARTNAEASGLSSLVEVREAALEEALAPDERFAVVIADPPWVPRESVDRYPEDPTLAIDGGPDGLDLARSCLRVAARHLVPGGPVLLQVGDREQAEALAGELEPLGGLVLREVRCYPRGTLIRFDRTPDPPSRA